MGVSHFSAISSTFSVMAIGSVTANKTLTAQEAVDHGIFTITVDAARDLIFPTAIEGKVIIVKNETGATHAVTVKVSGQTGIAVAATKTAILRCTGTDFVRVTADA
jgi:hypothetical protein